MGNVSIECMVIIPSPNPSPNPNPNQRSICHVLTLMDWRFKDLIRFKAWIKIYIRVLRKWNYYRMYKSAILELQFLYMIKGNHRRVTKVCNGGNVIFYVFLDAIILKRGLSLVG